MEFNHFVKDKDINYIVYDVGVRTNYNNIYGWISKFNRQTDGTVLTDTNWNNIFIYNGDTNNFANDNYAVEFEVLNLSGVGQSRFIIFDGISNKIGVIESTGVHRFTYNNGNMKHFVDGTEVISDRNTYDNTATIFQFIIIQTDSRRTMKFKGFKLYLI